MNHRTYLLPAILTCLALSVGCKRPKDVQAAKLQFTGTEGLEFQVSINQNSEYTGIGKSSFQAVVPSEQMMLGTTIHSVRVHKLSASGDLIMTILNNGTTIFQGNALGTNQDIHYQAD